MNAAESTCRKVRIVLGCDCDPDRWMFGGSRLDQPHEPLVWRGLEEGFYTLVSMLDDLPFPVPVTWNVRCDEQVAFCHGHAGWSLDHHGKFWDAARRRGDEIAWHNHTWRWSNNRNSWCQETSDAAWIAEGFEIWGEAFRVGAGEAAHTSHGGWFFQNGLTLAALARAGVRVDYSALPGRVQQGFGGVDGSDFANHYDWSITPRTLYHPSAADYRRPAQKGEAALPILVASTYTFQSRLADAFQVASYIVRRKSGGQNLARARSAMSIITITNHPALFAGLVSFAIKEKPEIMFLYFHADELLPEKPTWRTRLFSPAHIVANLRHLSDRFTRAGLEPVFGTCRGLTAPHVHGEAP